VTVLLTHDIDFTRSMNNVLAYAEDETSMGVPATYFIQAKYVKDYNDDLFLDISRRPILQRLSELGMEIASHTIAHSNEFRNMELGSGRESYPDYQPFVKTFDETHGGTIAGELRVSKYLLESLSDQTVTSFRPGHLSLPQALPQMLAATGYSYSSSITANEALTHFPYRMMFDRSYDAPVPVFEIPVTIEDEQGTLGNRVGDAVELSRRIAAYGGVVNILIHTDILDHKLEFQRRYIKAVKDIAWFGTMRGFGDWWVARDGLQLDVAEVQGQPGSRVIRLQSASRLEGLTLEVPKGWQLASGPAGTTQSGNRIVVGDFGEDSKAGTLHFRVP
jgi:peptidoglycan/xylan/chitin deacetylase (PgdA/CDA1 family)